MEPQMTPLEYATPRQANRPACITVISIIGICLGGVTILQRLLGVVAALVFTYALSTSRSYPGLTAFQIVETIVFTGFAIWQVVACIGCLKLKESARRQLVLYAMAYSAAVIVSAAVTMSIGFKNAPVWTTTTSTTSVRGGSTTGGGMPVINFATTVPSGAMAGPTRTPPPIYFVMAEVMVVISALVVLVLPAFILIYMRSSAVRMAFIETAK